MSTSGQLFATEITLDAKIHELERELAMRRRVYKRMIRQHRCSAVWAEEKIQIIEAILADYRALIARPRHLVDDARLRQEPT